MNNVYLVSDINTVNLGGITSVGLFERDLDLVRNILETIQALRNEEGLKYDKRQCDISMQIDEGNIHFSLSSDSLSRVLGCEVFRPKLDKYIDGNVEKLIISIRFSFLNEDSIEQYSCYDDGTIIKSKYTSYNEPGMLGSYGGMSMYSTQRYTPLYSPMFNNVKKYMYQGSSIYDKKDDTTKIIIKYDNMLII